jgi:pimeloyl-ACP methyl ester carboxylesterase
VPHIDLASSALANGVSPVRIHYRDAGSGRAIVILHGGWGYAVYPFDRQVAALADDYRVVIPDRTGYGGSGRLERQETDFHRRAAAETWAVIDALTLDRPVIWGHSDGAVIALLMGLSQPDRLSGIIVEAAHLWRQKPASRPFFETMMQNPDGLGDRVADVLARDHGERWRDLIRTNGDAWLRIAVDPSAPAADLYGGRLSDLHVPTLVIHGARDPRTEPGELEALVAMLKGGASSAPTADRGSAARGRPLGSAPRDFGPPTARVEADPGRPAGMTTVVVLPDGGHSPHSERATADEVTRVARDFVLAHLPAARPANR